MIFLDPVEREKMIRQRVKDLVQENFVQASSESNLSDEIIRHGFNIIHLMDISIKSKGSCKRHPLNFTVTITLKKYNFTFFCKGKPQKKFFSLRAPYPSPPPPNGTAIKRRTFIAASLMEQEKNLVKICDMFPKL